MNKTILIIGATSGIGFAIARRYGLLHHKLILAGRKINRLETFKGEVGKEVHILQLDVNDTANLTRKLDELSLKECHFDLIIYCAGIGDLNEALDLNIELLTTQTNINGFVTMVNWAFHHLKKQTSGHLVTITSVGGLRGNHLAPAYNASKAFQINYWEGLSKKIRKENPAIHLTEVRAGLIDTAMAKGEGLFWVAPVSKAADQIVAAIDKKVKVAYITKRWRLIAWLLKCIPQSMYLKI
jgi:short-subunit dehydrogenase